MEIKFSISNDLISQICSLTESVITEIRQQIAVSQAEKEIQKNLVDKDKVEQDATEDFDIVIQLNDSNRSFKIINNTCCDVSHQEIIQPIKTAPKMGYKKILNYIEKNNYQQITKFGFNLWPEFASVVGFDPNDESIAIPMSKDIIRYIFSAYTFID